MFLNLANDGNDLGRIWLSSDIRKHNCVIFKDFMVKLGLKLADWEILAPDSLRWNYSCGHRLKVSRFESAYYGEVVVAGPP